MLPRELTEGARALVSTGRRRACMAILLAVLLVLVWLWSSSDAQLPKWAEELTPR